MATYATSLGWLPAEDYAAFVEAYGYDVTRAPAFDLLRAVRELRMTSWIAQKAAESPAMAAQVSHRIATLADPGLPRHWAAA
jgi:hypothetical protein